MKEKITKFSRLVQDNGLHSDLENYIKSAEIFLLSNDVKNLKKLFSNNRELFKILSKDFKDFSINLKTIKEQEKKLLFDFKDTNFF